jgi:Lon protease-like protein
MFPLSAVLFPGAELPLHIFEPRYRELTSDCLAGDGQFGVVLIARGSEVGGGDQRYGVGTVAHIEKAASFDDGRWVLAVVGRRRFAVTRWLPDDPYPMAEIDDRPEGPDPTGETAMARATAAVRRARTLLSELGSPAPVVADLGGGTAGDEAGRVWRLCERAPLNVLDSQRLLETDDPVARLTLLAQLCDDLAGDLALLLGGGPGAGPRAGPDDSGP